MLKLVASRILNQIRETLCTQASCFKYSPCVPQLFLPTDLLKSTTLTCVLSSWNGILSSGRCCENMNPCQANYYGTHQRRNTISRFCMTSERSWRTNIVLVGQVETKLRSQSTRCRSKMSSIKLIMNGGHYCTAPSGRQEMKSLCSLQKFELDHVP